jgi:hypothetical protein
MRMTGYPTGRPGYVVDHIIALASEVRTHRKTCSRRSRKLWGRKMGGKDWRAPMADAVGTAHYQAHHLKIPTKLFAARREPATLRWCSSL